MTHLPRLLACLLFLMLAHTSPAAPVALKITSAAASSSRPETPAALAHDGRADDDSRWVSAAGAAAPHWIAFKLDSVQRLGGIHLYSGYQGKFTLADFTVQFWSGEAWRDIPSAQVTGNQAARLRLAFDDTIPVVTDRIRLFITATSDGVARVAEVSVWPYAADGIPPLPLTADKQAPVSVFLNQSGFNLGAPKRFTVPGAPDGAPFEVRPASGGPALFTGSLKDQIGDFTPFNPADHREFVVAVGDKTSVPFRIGPSWLERVTTQRVIDFMVDSRHYVGNDRRKCQGSYGWRDDHHFGWELHTLVPQWLANPSAFARLPRQVVYEAPTDPKLWGKLLPPAADAPDIIKLIHWGADVIVTQGLTHELLKSQLAYFLYAWPELQAYLPEQNYTVVLDYAFSTWTQTQADHRYPYDESPEHDLLALKTKIGNTKGAYPPGFSIQPNLLLHEVALREGRPDAAIYFEAAHRQTAWIVQNLDWNDPLTTKGQRMSEFITLTALGHFLASYPDRAPAGLREKIAAWAEVVVRRSNNLWDFRKLGDAPDQWTPMGERPTMWNEPGNVVGLPAAIFAALPHLSPAVQPRLLEIAWSHFDALFGRNPTGRHFSYDAPRELEGVEHGWYNQYIGGIGRLEEARFVIDGSPKNQHFPFHPEVGNVGWTEGWIQHNTPFNLSLAYLARSQTRLEATLSGDTLAVRLTAPLNFDYERPEIAFVTVTSAAGDRESLTLTETGPNTGVFEGRLSVRAASTARPGDGRLQHARGSLPEVRHGFGYLATTAIPTRVR